MDRLVTIQPNSELPITDPRISYFEGYMFATTPKNIKLHDAITWSCKIFAENGDIYSLPANELAARKTILSEFNKKLIKKYGTIPLPNRFSRSYIEFVPNISIKNKEDYWDILHNSNPSFISDLNNAVNSLVPVFSEFCKKNETIMAICFHFLEHKHGEYILPHMHTLYVLPKNGVTLTDYMFPIDIPRGTRATTCSELYF